MMKRMSEQTLDEFKMDIFKQAIELSEIKSLEETLEYVFKQAHERDQWAESKGIIE
ncbi:hypothetical protein J2W97_001224 [Paenibacillus jamilae]|nr:hypothetical protein [Paenibacillus jamilae]